MMLSSGRIQSRQVIDFVIYASLIPGQPFLGTSGFLVRSTKGRLPPPLQAMGSIRCLLRPRKRSVAAFLANSVACRVIDEARAHPFKGCRLKYMHSYKSCKSRHAAHNECDVDLYDTICIWIRQSPSQFCSFAPTHMHGYSRAVDQVLSSVCRRRTRNTRPIMLAITPLSFMLVWPLNQIAYQK